MIEHLIFKWKLNKLYRQREAHYKFYKQQKKDLSGEELHSAETEESHFAREYDESIGILVATFLIKKARRKFIAIPEFDLVNWEQCCVSSDRYILTEKALADLQLKIRKEQRETVDLAIKIIIGCTGLIGTLTGLVALIKK